jgi:uncharacterized protein HemY
MPLTKTKIYARILETQGFKQEALEIYEELLKEKEDPEIVEAIERLKQRKFFEGVNVIRLKEFNEINQLNRYDFEKWLSEI